jgi:hypothetical protein
MNRRSFFALIGAAVIGRKLPTRRAFRSPLGHRITGAQIDRGASTRDLLELQGERNCFHSMQIEMISNAPAPKWVRFYKIAHSAER